jgi:hypothetical protein
MLENLDTVTVVTLLVGVVIPLVVGLVTKWKSSSKFKNVALLALAALSSVLIPHVGKEAVDFEAVAIAFLQLFGVSTLTYLGLYKPSGITEALQAKVPGGLGKVDPTK